MAVVALVLIALLVVAEGTAGAAGAPAVSITPGATNGRFDDQDVVRVAVGPNATFTPNSRVVILECADPGGSVANLPTSLTTCDSNTIQPDTTVVHADGSFVEPSYTLYALPNSLLGEQANWQPVCNATHPCVLLVGEDQNDFAKGKAFSAAFAMAAAAGAVAPPAPSGSTTATSPSSPVSAAVSLSATQLAFTGASGWPEMLAGVGAALILLAWGLAALVRRSTR
jgi:hypothetical protein